MKISVSGKTYLLNFVHHIPDLNTKSLSVRSNGYTESKLYELLEDGQKKLVDSMISFVHPNDQYNKKVGRKRCIEKLFRKRSLSWMNDKESKKSFWRQYFKISNEKYVVS